MPPEIRVGLAAEIPEGGSKTYRVGARDVTVFNAAGSYFAVKDECPHQGVSLCGGALSGTIVTCPGHQWVFDLESGACLAGDPDLGLRKFPVVVSGGELFITLAGAA